MQAASTNDLEQLISPLWIMARYDPCRLGRQWLPGHQCHHIDGLLKEAHLGVFLLWATKQGLTLKLPGAPALPSSESLSPQANSLYFTGSSVSGEDKLHEEGEAGTPHTNGPITFTLSDFISASEYRPFMKPVIRIT